MDTLECNTSFHVILSCGLCSHTKCREWIVFVSHCRSVGKEGGGTEKHWTPKSVQKAPCVNFGGLSTRILHGSYADPTRIELQRRRFWVMGGKGLNPFLRQTTQCDKNFTTSAKIFHVNSKHHVPPEVMSLQNIMPQRYAMPLQNIMCNIRIMSLQKLKVPQDITSLQSITHIQRTMPIQTNSYKTSCVSLG